MMGYRADKLDSGILSSSFQASLVCCFFFLDRDRVITIQELTQKQNRTTTTKGLQSSSHWYTRVIYSVWLHLAPVGQKSMMFW